MEGHYLGDVKYDELFTELNRRKLVVFIHPNDPPGVNAFVEYPHDTARAVLTMMHAGILERYSKIRFVLAHAGDFLPLLADRMSIIGLGESVNICNILKTFIISGKDARSIKECIMTPRR